jgi:hypothetical protein
VSLEAGQRWTRWVEMWGSHMGKQVARPTPRIVTKHPGCSLKPLASNIKEGASLVVIQWRGARSRIG